MDVAHDDDKKPFDAETAPDEDSQPDPDEHLMLDQGNGRVWLVKVNMICVTRGYLLTFMQIPKFLMQRWSAINVEDAHLATLRVFSGTTNGPSNKPRIILFLPPNQDPNDPDATPPPQLPNRPTFDHTTSYTISGSEPDWYELDMVNESVENQVVVAERPKDPSLSASTTAAAATTNTRARTTILTGRIKHECNLRPAFSESYRKQMRQRNLKYNTRIRQIKMIEDAGVPGGRGGVNRLSSGVGVGAGSAFGDLIVSRFFIRPCLRYSFIGFTVENKTQASQGYVRAHGAYAKEPATRSALLAIQRDSQVEYSPLAG